MTAALGNIGFDKQDVASNRRPRQTDGDARPFHPIYNFILELIFWRAEEFLNNGRLHNKPWILPLQCSARVLAADIRDLPLEVANACLARVMPHDVLERCVLKVDMIRLQA